MCEPHPPGTCVQAASCLVPALRSSGLPALPPLSQDYISQMSRAQLGAYNHTQTFPASSLNVWRAFSWHYLQRMASISLDPRGVTLESHLNCEEQCGSASTRGPAGNREVQPWAL